MQFKRFRFFTTFILAAFLAVNVLAAVIVREPTANQTPDATLGGNAVTTPTNTGHASTGFSAGGGGAASNAASCRWHTFQSAPIPHQIIRIKLLFDHTSSGVLTGAGAANSFTVSYTVNGGSNWTNAVARTNFTASQGPTTFSVELPKNTDIAQIQVRDHMTASVVDNINESASVQFTVSNIRLEIVYASLSPIVMQ